MDFSKKSVMYCHHECVAWGRRVKMKRLLSLMLIILLVVTCLPANTFLDNVKAYEQDSVTYEPLNDFRITVDGEVYQANGYLGNNGELYFLPGTIKQLLGTKPTATTRINGLAYVNLKQACDELGIGSYEYNDVMKGAYIWTSLDTCFSDVNRLKFYNLGVSSDKQITYKEFFTILDKAVQIADQSKLNSWKSSFTQARSSSRTMTRLEGMMAMLNVAVMLGSSYSEFNTEWTALNEMIGNKVWDEIATISNPYQYIQNHYPYSLGGFQNDTYVYDWDDCGVAYRYSFGRSSLVNGKTLFDYDKALNSMRPADLMTMSEAYNAVTRFLDSRQPENKYIALTSAEAINYDSSYITDELLFKANEASEDNLEKWYGFVLPDGSYERTEIDALQIDKDFKRIAEWGFNSVRYMLTYQTLFDDGVTKVNLTNLKNLDSVIASAMKYNLHLNIVTFSLPGRWTRTNFDNYTTEASLDLFTNPIRQQEANAVWALISERYKEVPSVALSFCPLWEALNTSLSSGLPVDPYTISDVATVYKGLIDTIRAHDSDRYVIYEPTANNSIESIISESKVIKDTIEEHFTDTMMISNFCENPFVYAEMTAVQGEHIDHNNHSMFKPEYPVTIYDTQYHIDNGAPLILQGDLVKGTKIDIYLSQVSGSGTFAIKADDNTLYSEFLSDSAYSVDSPLSRYYPYAKSNKGISVSLPAETNRVEISYSGNWFEWSGIDVTLPEQYAVERWWSMSGYDAIKEGTNWTPPFLKSTSRIMLSPYSYNSGRIIKINSDITYETSTVYAQSNKQTIHNWGVAMAEFSPNLMVRFECAAFCNGNEYQSVLRYYDDLLSMCNEHKFSWLSNDFNNIFSYSADSRYGGGKRVPYQDGYLLVDMLKMHQKYLPTPIVIESSAEKESMSNCSVNLEKSSFVYSGLDIGPKVIVKNGLVSLIQGVDYSLTYTNNKDVGTATVKITGINNYTGTIIKSFTITAKPITSCIASLSSYSITYTGAALTPTVTVKDGTKTLVKNTDYTISYSNNTKVGSAKVTITGRGNYSGAISKDFQISAKSISGLKVTLSKTTYTYTGSRFTPVVTVRNGSKKLVKNTDYTVTYTNNLSVGTATVTIKGKGNYSGSLKKVFQIKPGISKIKLKAGTKQATISWSKVKGASGYELYLATSKKGKYTRIKTTNGLFYVKKPLIRGKKYYVKIRAYTNVKGKKVYGSFSSIGLVKIK